MMPQCRQSLLGFATVVKKPYLLSPSSCFVLKGCLVFPLFWLKMETDIQKFHTCQRDGSFR